MNRYIICNVLKWYYQIIWHVASGGIGTGVLGYCGLAAISWFVYIRGGWYFIFGRRFTHFSLNLFLWQLMKRVFHIGPSINNVTHLGGGSTKRWWYSISLFSKMGYKREEGVKILKKWVMSFMDSPIDKLKPIRRNRLLRFGSRL